ncbi:MAG TPA: diacylglycerol kinase family protein [Solirubrobacteraceae bacterium]|jgi:diacylglycerol kinase family enzyme
MRRRLWAAAALLLAIAATALAIVLAIQRFPRGLSVLVCVTLAAVAAWYALQRRGPGRALLAGAACVLLAGAVALVILEGKPLLSALVLVGLLGAVAAARNAYRTHIQLPEATPPRHPVLFYNPLSGGGKAERFHVAEQARRRGIEPIELRHGDDLEALVRAEVRRGADGLAMAGGDGSQAIVAMVASEHDLPYACIPAGTRNHFALDLGVDRDDVVGALDAFTCGGERVVDLAEVNGRVFVNNVSLGLYAEAVQRAGYREAKIRTLMNTVPDVIGPDAEPPYLHWGRQRSDDSGAAMLVSNNSYRLGRALGSGTRPQLDRGVLGIAVLGPTRERRNGARKTALGMRQWSAQTFEVESDRPVPAGIDGEALVLDPPLRFCIRSRALRVRIAPQHPGASPSALEPDSPLEVIGALAKFALGSR